MLGLGGLPRLRKQKSSDDVLVLVEPKAKTVRTINLHASPHLHLTMFVMNINRLLEELQSRTAGRHAKAHQAAAAADEKKDAKSSGKKDEKKSSKDVVNANSAPVVSSASASASAKQAQQEADMLLGMLSLLFDWGADKSMDSVFKVLSRPLAVEA